MSAQILAFPDRRRAAPAAFDKTAVQARLDHGRAILLFQRQIGGLCVEAESAAARGDTFAAWALLERVAAAEPPPGVDDETRDHPLLSAVATLKRIAAIRARTGQTLPAPIEI